MHKTDQTLLNRPQAALQGFRVCDLRTPVSRLRTPRFLDSNLDPLSYRTGLVFPVGS